MMLRKPAAILLALSALSANQISAAEFNGMYRLAQAEKSNTTGESGLSPRKSKTVDQEIQPDGVPVSDSPLVTGVRFLTTGTYTRVVMELSQPVRYETHRLPGDPSKNLPPRIYVDIYGARLAMSSKEPLSIDDGLLRQVRVAQFSQDVVRAVLDMTSFRNHNAFLLLEPY